MPGNWPIAIPAYSKEPKMKFFQGEVIMIERPSGDKRKATVSKNFRSQLVSLAVVGKETRYVIPSASAVGKVKVK
jgi:hypothetical protein